MTSNTDKARQKLQDTRRDRVDALNKQFTVYIPGFIGLGILIIVGLLPFKINPVPILAIALFLTGISGIIVIVRREIPTGFYVVKGKPAVVQGTIAVAILWGAALYLILFGLR